MKKAVIFDIDGVLAEKSPERTFIEYDKVHLDKPIPQVFELLDFYLREIDSEFNILFITGRKELCRESTVYFIMDNITYWKYPDRLPIDLLEKYEYNDYEESGMYDLEPNPKLAVAKLFMRGDTDHRDGEVLKKEIYENHIKGKYDIVAVYEDDPKICNMYKKEGLFVFQVGTRDDFCI